MRILLYCAAILVFFSCTNNQNSSWNPEIVSSETPKIKPFIDSEESGFLIGKIGEVKADRENNFYVSDLISQTIKKFDAAGNVIQEIGQRGRGMKEFMGINFFSVSSNSRNSHRIIIVDQNLSKISVMSGNDSLITSIRAPTATEYQGPFETVMMDDSVKYLFLYKMYDEAEDGSCLFHLFSQDLVTKETCFGEFDDLHNSDNEAFNFLTQAQPGRFIVDEAKKTIYYSPKFYEGNIYKYTYSDSEDSWKLEERLSGFVYHSKPIKERAEPTHYRLTYRGDRFYGRILNSSLGLFQTREGLVHFTRVTSPEGDAWFGMEEYDQNGTLQSYTRILNSFGFEDMERNLEIVHHDGDGTYYIADNYEVPTLYKMQF